MSRFVQTSGSFQPGARTMPGEYYTSPAVYEEERERIFAQQWVCVGRTDRLALPGDFFTRTIAGDSLIFLRDRSGTVKSLRPSRS